MPTRMSSSCREALLDVRKWSGDLPGCVGVVGGPLGCPGVIGMPSTMSWCGREAFTNVLVWLGGLHGCPGVVGKLSLMSGSVGRPSRMSASSREAPQMSGSGRKALLDIR